MGGRPSLPQPGGVGASSPQPQVLDGSAPASCPSCLSPRLEGRSRAGSGEGLGPQAAAHITLSPLPSLSGPPELPHHVIRDLPGRARVEAACLLLTSCPPLPCTSWEGA